VYSSNRWLPHSLLPNSGIGTPVGDPRDFVGCAFKRNRVFVRIKYGWFVVSLGLVSIS
jgi:hypothetical protein